MHEEASRSFFWRASIISDVGHPCSSRRSSSPSSGSSASNLAPSAPRMARSTTSRCLFSSSEATPVRTEPSRSLCAPSLSLALAAALLTSLLLMSGLVNWDVDTGDTRGVSGADQVAEWQRLASAFPRPYLALHHSVHNLSEFLSSPVDHRWEHSTLIDRSTKLWPPSRPAPSPPSRVPATSSSRSTSA